MFRHLKAFAGATGRGLCVFAVCGAAYSQPYPANPVHWIVPFPAGSGTDVMTRAIAQPLSLSLGKPVIVDNRAGANTLIGLEAAAKAAPDGYTMATVVFGSVVVNPFMYRKLASIDTYRDQILARPHYAPDEGWDDLEALQQVTLGDRMERELHKLLIRES
jgi:tripartite-type tricarboxylate transporter receptor subunit TctC